MPSTNYWWTAPPGYAGLLADGSGAAGARAAFFFSDTAPLSANTAAFALLEYTLDRLVGARP